MFVFSYSRKHEGWQIQATSKKDLRTLMALEMPPSGRWVFEGKAVFYVVPESQLRLEPVLNHFIQVGFHLGQFEIRGINPQQWRNALIRCGYPVFKELTLWEECPA